MNNIKVCELINSAFSNEEANILKACIEKKLLTENKIILDFEGITQFTTLFFNFSTGFFVKEYGKEKYDDIFELINLSELGESTYIHSYNNSLRNEKDANEIQKAILDIIQNIDDI